ncbi:MAG: hypothetical protein KY439_03810 [Actinobacteria bacterium]|nr:hypothetical protein [Actinomycetota bacterium]
MVKTPLEGVSPEAAPVAGRRLLERPPGEALRRNAFLVAGLLPSVWLTRRLPLGFFFMMGGWTLIAGVALFVLTGPVSAFRPGSRIRSVAKVSLVLVAIGGFLMAMMVAATFDARGDIPEWTDTAARALGIALEFCIAAAYVTRSQRTGRQWTTALPFVAAIGVATLGVALGRRLPYIAIVPIVGLAAARLALLPLPTASDDERPERHHLVATGAFFAWSTCVLSLQSRVLTRPAGIAATFVAFMVGIVILFGTLYLRRTRIEPWKSLVPATGVFVVTIFFFSLLMPSLAGYGYLFRIGLRQPAGLSYCATVDDDGAFERWYSTDLSRSEAIDATSEAFRSPPVSVWADDKGGTTGLIFGYRIEVSYFDEGTRLPGGAPCSTELHACVRMAVARSDNWD